MRWKAGLAVILAVVTASALVFAVDLETLNVAIGFFKQLDTNSVLLAVCSNNKDKLKIRAMKPDPFPPSGFSASEASLELQYCSPDNREGTLIKELSAQGIQSAKLEKSDPTVIESQLTSPVRIGVLLEADCPFAESLLRLASLKKFFRLRRPWFILTSNVNQSTLEDAFRNSKPRMFDVKEYLLLEYEHVKLRAQMEAFNEQVNAQVLQQIASEKEEPTDPSKVPAKLKPWTELEALVDSEVMLASPSPTAIGIDLYSIHRKTNHSAMQVEEIQLATYRDQQLLKFKTPTSVRRSNFNRTILRTSCGLLYYDYFNRSDELTTSRYDIFAQMTFQQLKQIEETMNFRMLIKCFDDYGWPTHGVFNGLVGFMQRHNAEITATGLLLRHDRMDVMDYIDGTFEFTIGLLFRQPNLAAVTNIFVLPFSHAVWLALAGLLAVACFTIWWQLRVGVWLHHGQDGHHDLGDVFTFLSGVVTQQGIVLGVETVAVRVSILVILVSSLFLFTSYSASIVALLQSPAYLINTLEDFAKSSLSIGIEDILYERKFLDEKLALACGLEDLSLLLKEDHHAAVVDIYEHKVKPAGEGAFLNSTEGIRNVRKGMFGFQCELSNAYKLISETFNEHEKCGLNRLNLFTSHVLGPGVAKHSPYREILTVKTRWLREVGLTRRTINRWSNQKPQCEVSHSGFSSVGLTDVFPLVVLFAYGVITSLFLLFAERLAHRNGITRRFLEKKNGKAKFFKKRKVKNDPKWPFRE